MTARERTLGVIVGGLLGVFAIFATYNMISGSLAAKDVRIKALTEDVAKSVATNAKALDDRRRVLEYQRRSLPASTTTAQREYDGWIKAQLHDAGLKKITTISQAVRDPKQVHKELTFQVNGEGNLSQVTQFFYNFLSSDHLHRIRTAQINRIRDSKLLGLSMTVNALSMPDLEGRKIQSVTEAKLNVDQVKQLAEKLPLGTSAPGRLELAQEEYLNTITNRNLFGPANRSPSIVSIPRQEVQLGERLSYQVKYKDPDEDEVRFELGGDAPDGVKIDESGQLSWKPEELGNFKFTVYATDTGIPARVDERTISVVVKEKEEPRVEVADNRPGIDESKLARLTAILQGPRTPEPTMCMHLQVDGDFQYLKKGDKIEVGDWEGVVTAVEPRKNEARFRTDKGEYKLRIGEMLADAKYIEAEEL